MSLRIFHSLLWSTVKSFSVVSEAEVDVSLELPCLFYDPKMLTIWSLLPLLFLNPTCTSGSSQFMYCWSVAWRILSIILAGVWNESNCSVVWIFFGIVLLWDKIENWLFSSPVATADFSKFAGILSAALSEHYLSEFQIVQLEFHNPLALFIVMLPKAHLSSHSMMSGSRRVITPSWLSGSLRSFLYSSSVFSCHLLLFSSASIRSIPFLSFLVSIFA